ncbi:MAG: tyrosine-type recombinase/integrase [Clostridia bacterium]|nr:tyrosine-type recombinase/integrase [Clostridia bacterium]MBQ9599262.1 tyrosine-type recombinase/integrase [Clostridia bacterium]MBR0471051.1 tyrosine-type recombinase/integrase [Clostridia bacterium]
MLCQYDFTKNRVFKQISLSAYAPHIFRHTYTTNLYYAGVDIKTAQYLLGHSDIKMTLEIYTHLDNKRVDESTKKLNEYFLAKINSSDSQNIVNG